jgi:hypothetical protein
LVLAAVPSACDSSDEAKVVSTTPSQPPSDGVPVQTTTGDADQRKLDEALDRIGVDRPSAPARAVTLDGASYCGFEDLTEGRLETSVRQCFEEAHLGQAAALFVSYARTNEGDPWVQIYRTSKGVATFFTDQTRDRFGSGRWESGSCAEITIASGPPPESAPVFTCAG